eukprot:Opistho-2@69947
MLAHELYSALTRVAQKQQSGLQSGLKVPASLTSLDGSGVPTSMDSIYGAAHDSTSSSSSTWRTAASALNAIGFDLAGQSHSLGILPMQNLLYLATRYPADFARIYGRRVQYPMAAAAMSITRDLLQMLKISSVDGSSGAHLHAPHITTPPNQNAMGGSATTTAVGGGVSVGALAGKLPPPSAPQWESQLLSLFCHVDHEEAFEETFCAVMDLLDREFVATNAGYRQFAETRLRVLLMLDDFLSRRPLSIEELRTMISTARPRTD